MSSALRAHALMATARQFQRLPCVVRQQAEKSLDQVGVVAEAGRKPPQERPELFPQIEDARGEHTGQRRFDVAQAQDMGEVAVAFVAEDEARRRGRVPGGVAVRPLQRVRRAIDFDAGQGARSQFQLARLGQPGRITHASPRRITPSRNADVDLAHGASAR